MTIYLIYYTVISVTMLTYLKHSSENMNTLFKEEKKTDKTNITNHIF